MLFFGHIAIALAAAETTQSGKAAAVLGNLTPDIVDKTGCWILKVMPRGRWLAHGLPFMIIIFAATRPLLPKEHWRGFVLGYLSHLAADHYNGGKLPWLAPFQEPPPSRHHDHLRLFIITLIPEVLGLAYIAWKAQKDAGTSP